MKLFKKKNSEISFKDEHDQENIFGITALIKVYPTFEHKVIDKILKFNLSLQLYPVFGDYDFVLIVYVKPPVTFENAFNLVSNIRNIEGVQKAYALDIPKT